MFSKRRSVFQYSDASTAAALWTGALYRLRESFDALYSSKVSLNKSALT